MKPGLINGRWTLQLPDAIADWDAITGNHADRQGWEFCRFESFDTHLKPGMVTFDIGAEHGWISAVIAQHYVGGENVVLFEPSPEFWVNIRKIWEANDIAGPRACFPGFVDSRTTARGSGTPSGWPNWTGGDQPEVDAMAYRSLHNDKDRIEVTSITIDEYVSRTKIHPEVLNIDVEGAELWVLMGARRTLVEDRPLVWCSVHPDLMLANYGIADVQALFDFMAGCGYGREYLGTDHEQHHFFAPLEYVSPTADPRPS